MKVNDQLVVANNYRPSEHLLVTLEGRNVIVKTDFGLIVKFDGNHYVTVSVPDTYRGST